MMIFLITMILFWTQFLIKNDVDGESVGAFRLRPVDDSYKIERMGILPQIPFSRVWEDGS